MREAAGRIGCAYSTLKRYIANGWLRPEKVSRPEATGHVYRFSARDIQRAYFGGKLPVISVESCQ
jgi:DNA-binding transcriptional MerR regulator